MSSPEMLRMVVGWTIVVAWAASLVLDAVLRDYDPSPSIHILMMVVAGALFGPSILHRNGRRDG